MANFPFFPLCSPLHTGLVPIEETGGREACNLIGAESRSAPVCDSVGEDWGVELGEELLTIPG